MAIGVRYALTSIASGLALAGSLGACGSTHTASQPAPVATTQVPRPASVRSTTVCNDMHGYTTDLAAKPPSTVKIQADLAMLKTDVYSSKVGVLEDQLSQAINADRSGDYGGGIMHLATLKTDACS